MNPQLTSLIRSLLKVIGTLLIAHGATNVGNQLMAEPIVELVAGVASAAYGFYLSQKKASQIPVVAVPNGTDATGNTQFLVRPANAVVTKADPTPQKVTEAQPATNVTVPKP